MIRRATTVVGVTSARPDGATSVAIGLAATLAATRRTLIIDLNLDRAEVADLLDLPSDRNLYHLAYIAQLGPLTASDLEQHTGWRDGLGCIAGVPGPEQGRLIEPAFLRGLLLMAAERFDAVVVDHGRLRPDLMLTEECGHLLLAVTPNSLGLAALDGARSQIADGRPELWARQEIVMTRTSSFTAPGALEFFHRAYGMTTIGDIPHAEDFWRELVGTHSLRAFLLPRDDDRQFARANGEESLRMNAAFGALGATLAAPSEAVADGVG